MCEIFSSALCGVLLFYSSVILSSDNPSPQSVNRLGTLIARSLLYNDWECVSLRLEPYYCL